MKISEIMTRDVKTLAAQAPVTEALRHLLSAKISGLPVVDASGKIVGIFTEKDVLRTILPSYVSQVGRFVYENSPKTLLSKIAKLQEYKVSDLMRKEIVKVSPDASVYEVAHLMLTQDVRRIPIVDSNDKIIGIVARADVLEQMLKG